MFQRLFWGALAGGLFALFFGDSPLLETLELNMLNARYNMADQITAGQNGALKFAHARLSRDISIVAFDDVTQFDYSIERFSSSNGQAFLAEVIDRIERGGPAIVAIDLNLKNAAHPELVKVFRRYRNVVLAWFGGLEDEPDLPSAQLLEHARLHGYHELHHEANGTVVRLPIKPVPTTSNLKEPSIQHAYSFTEAVITAYNDIKGLGPQDEFGSIQSDQPVYLDFHRTDYPAYSMSEVVGDNFDPSVFKDRIVLIGSILTPRKPETDREVQDVTQPATPIRPPGPEVFVHADGLQTLLTRQVVYTFPYALARHILIVLGAVFGALFSVLPLGRRAIYAVGACATIVLAGQLSLLMFHVALPVVAPLAMLGSGFIIGTVIFLDTDLRVRNRELAAARESMQIRAEEERKRIAGDLHDETLPALSSVARMIDELGEEHQESSVPLKMRRKLDETIQEMRRVINDLHPSVLETMGFVPALENLAVQLERDTGIQYSFSDATGDLSNGCEISDFAKLQLYRIVQEALNNVGKHSRAKIVDVCIKQHADDLEISIIDNGQGINPKAVRPDSHGLTNIKHRAQLIGAHVEWRKPRKFETGTEIKLTIPLIRENGTPSTNATANSSNGKPAKSTEIDTQSSSGSHLISASLSSSSLTTEESTSTTTRESTSQTDKQTSDSNSADSAGDLETTTTAYERGKNDGSHS